MKPNVFVDKRSLVLINKVLTDERGEVKSSFANVTGITPNQHIKTYKLPAIGGLKLRNPLR